MDDSHSQSVLNKVPIVKKCSVWNWIMWITGHKFIFHHALILPRDKKAKWKKKLIPSFFGRFYFSADAKLCLRHGISLNIITLMKALRIKIHGNYCPKLRFWRAIVGVEGNHHKDFHKKKKKKCNLTNDIHDVESFESQPAKVECHRDPNQWLHVVMLWEQRQRRLLRLLSLNFSVFCVCTMKSSNVQRN